MFKLLLIVVVVAVLAVGGVVEIKFHPDQLAHVPGRLLQLASNKEVLEKSRAFVVKIKRQGELAIAQDEEQRFALSLTYVKSDAARLQELTQAKREPSEVLPQAELLTASVDRVRVQAEKVPLTTLTRVKDESRDTFTAAQASLERLETLRSQYESLQDQFARLTDALRDDIHYVAGTPKVGDVAGATDER